METRVVAAGAAAVTEAAALLLGGGVVAIPTETVYGLAANALDDAAIASIYAAKGRPSVNPLIVHVLDANQAKQLAQWNDYADELTTAFWPGPLTILLKRSASCPVSMQATAGLDTIALRAPAHPVARAVIKESGLPLAAPSANTSGDLSPTTAEHVLKFLRGRIPMVIAGGAAKGGVESTVIDLTSDMPMILRPGLVTRAEIENVLGHPVLMHGEETEAAPKSPGLLLKHYAPKIPVRLRAVDVKPGEALLAFGSTRFMGVQGGGSAKDLPAHAFRNLSENSDLYEAASNLFAYLHALDDERNKGIAVMDIPREGVGLAIIDRLTRAANAQKEDA